MTPPLKAAAVRRKLEPMYLVGAILLPALIIPIMGIMIDSPIGRAIARRLEEPHPGSTLPPTPKS